MDQEELDGYPVYQLVKLPKEEDHAVYADASLLQDHSFRHFEGWKYADSAKVHARTGQVHFKQLNDFLYHRSIYRMPDHTKITHRFHFLAVSRLQFGRCNIAMPKSTYESIKQAWGLHDLTMEAFLHHNGVFTRFDTDKNLSVFLKVPISRSMGLDCMSLSHDKHSNTTYVLCHSLAGADSLFDALEAHPERCMQPFAFPAMLYRSHQRHIELYRTKVDDAIVTIEAKTKLGGPGRLFGNRREHEEIEGAVDFTDLAKRLSYVQTEMAIIGNCARFSLSCGQWMLKTLEEIISQPQDSTLLPSSAEILTDIKQETEYVVHRAMSVQSQLQQLHDRVHSQSTFLLNSITQNEAANTAAIAADSKRDSTAVKIIAILTMLFLPGTFVATFFSMTMFDWSPSGSNSISGGDTDGELKVSNYIWVYWAVSIPLTMLVMAWWIVWNRRETAKMARRRGDVHNHLPLTAVIREKLGLWPSKSLPLSEA